MLKNDTPLSYALDTLLGALLFFCVVVAGTYYLQSSLVVFKHYGSYTHWMVVLIALPVGAGLCMRLAHIIYPLISSLLGALGSAALLFPLYKRFWAEPPTTTDLLIYVAVVFGIGFIATQPLRTTFMVAFRLGRFSVPTLKSSNKKPIRKASMSNTQRLQSSSHGNIIAMLELLVGVSSLVLSILSVFVLGRS